MVAEIRQFDDLAWMQVRTPEDLISFRHGSFDGPPREMPPIVVVTYPATGRSILRSVTDAVE